MAHTATCRYAQSPSAVEWSWVEGMDPEEVCYHASTYGVDIHTACFGELMVWEDEHPEPTPATRTSFGDLSAIP